MANFTKNLFIGVAGAETINLTHHICALEGVEAVMGRVDTPGRRLLNSAFEEFCPTLPALFVMTVIGTKKTPRPKPSSRPPLGGGAAAAEEGGAGDDSDAGVTERETTEEAEEAEEEERVTRGLFIGDTAECFEAAAKLSLEVNFTLLDAPCDKVPVIFASGLGPAAAIVRW